MEHPKSSSSWVLGSGRLGTEPNNQGWNRKYDQKRTYPDLAPKIRKKKGTKTVFWGVVLVGLTLGGGGDSVYFYLFRNLGFGGFLGSVAGLRDCNLSSVICFSARCYLVWGALHPLFETLAIRQSFLRLILHRRSHILADGLLGDLACLRWCSHSLGCTQRGSYSAKGTLLLSKHLPQHPLFRTLLDQSSLTKQCLAL